MSPSLRHPFQNGEFDFSKRPGKPLATQGDQNEPPKPAGRESRLIESFSKHAKTYDRHAQLQKAMAERLASLLPCPLPDKILEVGCGTGTFTRHLLVRPADHLILNDLVPAMIDRLREQLHLPSNTEVVLGNAETLTFPEVQLIGANAVFQWFQNPGAALKKFSSGLTPGGCLVFSVFGPNTLKEFRETGGLHSPATLCSLTQWKNLLEDAGFRIVEVQEEIRRIFFPSTLAMIKNLQQIGAAPLRMVRSGTLRKLIRQYDSAYSTPQGVYTHWELYYISSVRVKD